MAAAEEAAREAASQEAPAADVPDAPAPPPVSTLGVPDAPADEELAAALDEAKRTGKQVELVSETTESSISYAQPDGTVKVESAAGPVRAEIDGDWVDVDTTLEFTADGVRPAAVTGEIVFSDGGTDPMAVLGDGEQTSIALDWAGKLPKPVLDGNKATYRNVFPQVDLVLTATRLGFEQHLLVKKRPDAATLEALSSLEFPMATEGAAVSEGGAGQLEVIDPAGVAVGTAAAPLMWDSRTDPRTDNPVAVEEIGLELAAPSAPGDDSTLVLTPPQEFLTDPATVYPVTIDPTQVLGALGDTFVQSNIATSPQGGSTELRVGTYGSGVAARSLLKFDVGAVRDRAVQSANLALFEFHSYSCEARWVDIRDISNFDPNTATWNSQPWFGGIVANANVAFGYSSACPARWVDFNMTEWMRGWSDSRNGKGAVMALGVTSAENDVKAWKKFNSGNAAGNVPLLTFTYDARCDQYAGAHVCGAIRDKYYSVGGPFGFLGMPLNNETAINGGAFNHFQNGSIYWSPSTGAHIIRGAIRDRWGQLGWENSFLGYPTIDETATPHRTGAYIHFTNGSIYWSPATGAWEVSGLMRDKWAATGWENGPLGFPTSTKHGMPQPNHFHQYFEKDALLYQAAGAPAAYWVSGPIRAKYASMSYERSFLGFPTSDPTAMAGGTYNNFQGGTVLWSQPTGAKALRGPIRDKYASLGWANSSLGFPLTDEVAVTGGTYSDFSGGSIYFSPTTGARILHGEIRDLWSELGDEAGVLRFPTTDEYPTSYGKRQDFSGGQILREADKPGPRYCTITGTDGPDRLLGTESADVLCGLGGNDVIDGLGGDDAISGDAGLDTILAGDGIDGVSGGPGDDAIDGGTGDDLLFGDSGDDQMLGAAGADEISGQAGFDAIDGGDGADRISGGDGDDVVQAGLGDDVIEGGNGHDDLSGGAGLDALTGGEGADTLAGGGDADTARGGDGDDTLTGDDGSDTMSGGAGQDNLDGGSGEDLLDGGPVGDAVTGGADPDTCTTGTTGTEMSSCEEVVVLDRVGTVASYIEALAPEVDVVAPTTTGDTFTAVTGGGTVTAPLEASGAVSVTGTVDAPMPATTISLPTTAGSQTAQVASDGTIVYTDANGLVDVGVQALDGGVRLTTTLASAAAPSRFDYRIGLPAGHTLRLESDGSVAKVAPDGSAVGGFAAPWAKDANGVDVPTRYEVNGSTLTQVVDHSRDGIAYPVVADPSDNYWWKSVIHNYKGQWSGYPTVSGRLSSNGKFIYQWVPGGFLKVQGDGWREWVRRVPMSDDRPSMVQQFKCHVWWGERTHESWDLEAARQTRSDWWAVWSHSCNWPLNYGRYKGAR